jgi:hypothetical protein
MKRRIVFKRIAFTVFSLFLTLACVGLLFHSLFAQRYVQAAADAIATGKTQLFQRSVSGVLNSYQTFLAAYANDYASTTDPAEKIKIRVYLAFTRMLDVVLRSDGGSLTELLAQYGVTRTQDAFDGMKFNLPLNDDQKVILPAGAPFSAEALRGFFSGPFLTAVNASIADMDAAIALCPTDATEGADREIISKTLIDATDATQPNVEMDAGDYYLFRAFLKFLKAYALMSAGYNADLDIRQIVAIANMEMGPEVIKRLLDRYPEFLKVLPDTGAAKLNEARLTLIDAITDYETASAKIRGDINTQTGAEELFSIDITELAKEAFLREQMTLARNSLQNNTAVALGGADEWWNFSILTPESKTISIALEDRFSSGSYSAYVNTGCDTKFGCNARLEYALIDGNNVTLRFNFYYPYYGWSEFQGTLNPGKTQITNGTYIGYSSYSVPQSYSGTFSAARINVRSKTENTNLFPLFGDVVATPPKALRDLLPQLNEYGYPLPGTMGNGLRNDPTLGGILPDFTTQDRWVRDMEGAFMPTGPLTIAQVADGAIAINGNTADWTGIAPTLTDVTGEKGQYMATNCDLQSLFLARDSTYLYVRMDMNGDVTGPSVWQQCMYGLRFRQTPDGRDKPGEVKVFTRYRNSAWEVKGQSIQTNGWYGSQTDLVAQGGAAAVAVGNVVEWRVPLTSLGTIDGRFLSADTDGWYYNSYEWENWYPYDRNPTCLQIQPSASVTGTLSVPGYDGVGPVRIGVFEYGPDFSTDPKKRIGSLGIYPDVSGNLPATYTISGLPVGKKVFVTVFWDRDNNGVISPGDYTNFSLPFTTAAGANSLNLTTSDDHNSYPPPRFYTAVVYHMKQPLPPNGTGTWNVLMAAQLTGPSPDDVTVTVTGPGGRYYTLMPGAVIRERGLVFTINVPWVPSGDYTFTAVDSLGRKAETTYHYEERYDLPSIASLSPANNFYVGTAVPTLSWTKPADGYAYQVWVFDYNNSGSSPNGVTWYVSAITTDTSVTIPAGVLLPNTPYRWYVRLYDRANNPMNFTMSPVNLFYTGAYAATPAFSSVTMYTRPPTGSNLKYVNNVDARVAGLAPWDVTGWRLKKGSALINTSQGGTSQGSGSPWFDILADTSSFNPSFQTDAPLLDGNDYSFEMDVKRPAGSITTITQTGISFIYSSVQAVDLTSLVPSGNYYFKTSTPTFSWNPVSDPNTYYRLRIFDPLWGKFSLWRSAWSKETSATVPVGVLKPGGNYNWTVQTTLAINPSYVVAFANTEGNSANKALFRFTLQPPQMGDVSGNGEVNLEDAILALQVVSGFTSAVTLPGEVNADNRIGLPEAIYILQTVSGLR